MDLTSALAVFALALAGFGLVVGALLLTGRASGRCLRGSCGGASAQDEEGQACPDCPNRRRPVSS
jgi:hypothetical protein